MKTYKLVLQSAFYSISYVFRSRTDYSGSDGQDCLKHVIPFMLSEHPEAREMIRKLGAPTHMRLERVELPATRTCVGCGSVMEPPYIDLGHHCINCQPGFDHNP